MAKKWYDNLVLSGKRIFLFGHCSATLEIIDLLESKGMKATAILDNSDAKQGQSYKDAVVVPPGQIRKMAGADPAADSIVLIASRFYEAMLRQLRELGYEGPVCKVANYNTYAEYSLSKDTIAEMKLRERHGRELLAALSDKYGQSFKVLCPFHALGDIYFMMSYWGAFAKKRGIGHTVFCVAGNALADVIHMFGDYLVEVYEQKELDAIIQSAVYSRDRDSFIAHQDRPYMVDLSKALYLKMIPLEQIYCCGVFGLPVGTRPAKPRANMRMYKDIHEVPAGRAVIFSPYAKSVTAVGRKVWENAVSRYAGAGYKCYTNVIGDEKPLAGTDTISPSLLEIRSVVERAGTFVGIRSGLCDVLREAKAKKIALYPDYNYCDTKWKSIEMYHIDQFEYNLSATEEIAWERL